ncbi:hypothetical protein EDEG_00984 [Edhazardia aedis USNM 41457]|uniref:ERCC4 domain-containing protein n=1 Tax=Edhazardia aedis (strain USNM 41457) TaxID=1003232 RepID=J9DBE2_EDHAE|nr:hypothetical protein EDEG_00984 [Edhazardia aedis USNM 41457]|eukprot:EJW04814.1 hypothetical protein EDEG_00984 [Edhazardia aedis USNM 41457]
MLLEFEKNILEETTCCSNLLVLGKGLGKEKIIYHQLSFYANQQCLVLCLNFSENEIMFLKNKFNTKYIHFDVPNNIEKRREFYKKGGIFVASENVFVCDLVNNVIPVYSISAVFISNAENLKKDSTFEFIIDYIVDHSEDTVIRGYTDNPIFLDLDLAMSILQVGKAFFYPRFSDVVVKSLPNDTKFFEKSLKLDSELEEIQILLLETIKGILNEIKAIDKFNYELRENLDDFDATKLPVIMRILRKILDNQGYKSNVRRLISDVKSFRVLMNLLFSVGFVCCYNVLESMWEEQISMKEKSTWINTESGFLLIEKAIEYLQKQKIKNIPIEEKEKSKNAETDNQISNCLDATTTIENDVNTDDIIEVKQNNEQNANFDEDNIKTEQEIVKVNEKNKSRKYDDNLRQQEDVINRDAEVLKIEIRDQINEIMLAKRKKKQEDDDEIKTDSDEEFVPLKMNEKYVLNQGKFDILRKTLEKVNFKALVLVQSYFVKDMLHGILSEAGILIEKSKTVGKIYEFLKAVDDKHGVTIMTHDEFKYCEIKWENIIFLDPDMGSIRKIEVLQNRTQVEFLFELEKKINTNFDEKKQCDIDCDSKITANVDESSQCVDHEKKTNYINENKTNFSLYKPESQSIYKEDFFLKCNKKRKKHTKNTGILSFLNKKEEKNVLIDDKENNNDFSPSISHSFPIEEKDIRKEKIFDIKNVFIILYKDSIEEQKYFNDIRNEKYTFEKLITKFLTMPLSKKDNKIVLDEEDRREYIIIIDFRESRSKLPYYLYKSQNNISLSSIDVGDYILGINTCVERKAIGDLIQSLNSGRLYLQGKMMTYKFKSCYLLIEFNNRPCLSDYYVPTVKFNLMTKLVLFILNFPNIRLIWSNNEIITSKIFRTIQKGEENPELVFDIADPVLTEVLLNIPGIDHYNYRRIMASFKNIKELANLSLEILCKFVGKEKGTLIYNFFNKKL